jgi:hypothetical protein
VEGRSLAPWSGLELTTLRLIAYAPECRVFFRSESKQDSSWVSDGAWISVLTATVSQQGLAPRNEIRVWLTERGRTRPCFEIDA